MSKRKTTEQFIKEASTIHDNKYNYSLVNYINSQTKVKIVCDIHGMFEQTPNSHLTKQGCPKCKCDNISIKRRSNISEFIKKANNKYNDKYDYSLVEYINSITKVKIICPDHGMFEQTPKRHIHGTECKQCTKLKISNRFSDNNQTFLQKANKVHNNKYDYSLIEYKNTYHKVKIICSIHGEFEQRPNDHLHGNGCPYCINVISKPEKQIAEIIDCEFTQSDRSVIAPLELDIYIPDKNIAIEYNGLYWHSEQKGKDRKYHLNKTEQCESRGIQLIHIFEDEWINKLKIVRSRLRNLTGQIHRSIYARKCEIREIDTKTKGKFLDKYHIQGNDKSRVKLGLFYKERLVAVMTFGKSRYSKKVEWELIRYCTISNFRITGGAGKLLKHFEREYKPKSLVSYADRRWSQGKVYKALGFEHSHNSTPNYFYLINKKRQSRVQFQKHKLKDKLEVFDASKTEYQNMLMNGIDRIWDCGNMVFIKEY